MSAARNVRCSFSYSRSRSSSNMTCCGERKTGNSRLSKTNRNRKSSAKLTWSLSFKMSGSRGDPSVDQRLLISSSFERTLSIFTEVSVRRISSEACWMKWISILKDHTFCVTGSLISLPFSISLVNSVFPPPPSNLPEGRACCYLGKHLCQLKPRQLTGIPVRRTQLFLNFLSIYQGCRKSSLHNSVCSSL